jgi:exonuclease VII small subunit
MNGTDSTATNVESSDETDTTSDNEPSKTTKKTFKKSPAKITKREKALAEAVKEGLRNIKKLETHLEKANKRVVSLLERRDKVQHVLRWSNPFFLLGAYPKIGLEYFNSYPDGRPYYEKYNYGLINDPDYCEITDFYNLAHPENMFGELKFFTDYAKNGLARTKVIRKIGVDTMHQVSRYMDKNVFNSAQFHLNPTITNFFTKRVDLHIYHMVGKNFNCATQMYNHIPGHGVLKRKDLIVDSVDNYAKKFEDRPHCFNKHKFFPYSYRLYIREECEAFFEEINSDAYKAKLEIEPIQYVIKVGFGAHRAMGVFLLDKNETERRKAEYDNGNKCGIETKSLIAQTYITNPLLLNLDNKFDFRVYMLIASTNPLIVYYHDGFLRVSLHSYNKHSEDKSVHLTNTHLAKDTFALAKEQNITFHGMNEQELRDYQMWTFDRLNAYLLRSGKITDPNWVDNYLRPEFYKAFIHTARMSAHAFWKQSNVYEMFGLDFMLDDKLNLWFIECNSSPQLIGTNELKTNFLVKMLNSLFEIQHNFYRSRMKRVLNLIKKINKEGEETGKVDYELWRDEYKDAVKNVLEPEYQISEDNSFKLILDQNLPGEQAYFGHLNADCADY